jgi:hypothetical protein
MRVAGFIAGLVVAAALLALWALEAIVRAGTCGPAEGGGSCKAGVLSWLLLAGAIAAALAAVLVLVLARSRR